jgi:A/G-specific adenine glycosylase
MPKALSPTTLPSDFARRLVRWQRQHGRHDLPWQNTRDPYRVWLSEIMLQQTQVSTVLDYYERFLTRCPDVAALAAAPPDVVMGLWSGLGYYSRARNLHRCAQVVVSEYDGVFPCHAEQLQTLPGIGRSTAAAIASLCHEERVAILDGNVRRVLTRLLAFEEDLAQARAEKHLWMLAQDLLPKRCSDMPAYTQGVMDLGATLCTRSRPRCEACPVQSLCQAAQRDEVDRFPVKTRKLRRTAESWWWLLAFNPQDEVWLVKRPSRGIWADLHCLPLFEQEADLMACLPPAAARQSVSLPVFKHVLTHKDLHLHTQLVRLGAAQARQFASTGSGRWCAPSEWHALGLPTPVRQLLTSSMGHPARGDDAG